MSKLLITLTRHPVGFLGAALTTASGVLFLVLFGVDLVGFEGGPYVGILTFMIVPGIFVFGLVLMPVGVWLTKRRQRREGTTGEENFPVIDLNREAVRKTVLVFFAATLVNVAVMAVATYKGIHFMETTEFCGTTCHTVMSPEYTTYQASPHGRVRCVECHIGPGAGWFVKSKLSGSWQLVSVALDLYPTPIPTPVHNLRPARETCEQCHWPDKFVGDRLKVITRYQEDEENTALKTVLLLRVGGVEGRQSHGIHWHVDPGHEIRYRSDVTRETVYEVEMTGADGTKVVFHGPDEPPAPDEDVDEGDAEHDATAWRVMDCIDCHNRPSHVYKLPAQELDTAMESGAVAADLPYVKREGMRLLQEEWASHDEARTAIPAGLQAFYAESYPDLLETRADDIRRAGDAMTVIWTTNVHPQMNVTWGTYPNHIGHAWFDGCFRCHSDEHESDDGQVISQDCDTCHSLLAYEEEDPDILTQLSP